MVTQIDKMNSIYVYQLLDIKLILDDNKENLGSSINYQDLGEVYLIKLDSDRNHMNNKYCIIDESKVIDGSYN